MAEATLSVAQVNILKSLVKRELDLYDGLALIELNEEAVEERRVLGIINFKLHVALVQAKNEQEVL